MLRICLLFIHIFRKSEAIFSIHYRRVNQNGNIRLSIADEIIKSHAIATEYGIYELSVCLSVKFRIENSFVVESERIKRRGRRKRRKRRKKEEKGKIDFTEGTSVVYAAKVFLLYHQYTRFSSHVRGSRYRCTRTGVLPFSTSRKQKRRVRSVITILSRCSWDLYLWLRVQGGRGEEEEGGEGRSNDKSEWIARGLGERRKRGETRAIRSSCSPRKFSFPLSFSSRFPRPLARSRTRVQAYTLSRSWSRQAEEMRKGNKESREDHY